MPPKSRKNAKSSKSEKISQQSTPSASPFPPAPAQLPVEPRQQFKAAEERYGGMIAEALVDVVEHGEEDHFAGQSAAPTIDASPWPEDFAFGSPPGVTRANDLVSFDFDEEPNNTVSAASPFVFGSPPAIPIPAPLNQTPLSGSLADDEPAAEVSPPASAQQPVPSSPPVISSLSASLRKHAQTPPFSIAAPAAPTSPAAPVPPRAPMPPRSPSPPRSPAIPNISIKHPSRPVSPTSPAVPKRYPVPAPVARLEAAVGSPVAAVVDLGTARRGSVSSGVPRKPDSRSTAKEQRLEIVTSEDQEVGPSKIRTGMHRVLWSKWDSVQNARGSSVTKLLLVGYKDPPSLSIWDCTKLDSLVEVFRAEVGGLMEEPGEWAICHAAVLPDAPRRGPAAGNDRPVVGILVGPDGESCTSPGRLLLYSLKSKKIVKKVDLEGSGRVHSFSASSSYITISTTSPPQIHVFSAATFERKHIYDASQISPFNPPAAQSGLPLHSSAGAAVLSKIAAYSQLASPIVTQARNAIPERKYGHGYGRSLDAQEAARMQTHHPVQAEHWEQDNFVQARKLSYYEQTHPAPVFSLSHRLLAFASPISSTSRSSTPADYSAHSSYAGGDGKSVGLGMGSGPAGLPGNQAELGSAALKVGGSVWGGMRTLGGMALSAARNRVAGNVGESQVGQSSGRGGRFFSRSAPEGNGDWITRGDDGQTSSSPGGGSSSALPWTPTYAGTDTRSQVVVVDLTRSTREKDSASPVKVAEFALSREKQPAAISFSPDGCSLAIAPYDGHTIKVYQLRTSHGTHPEPKASLSEYKPTSTSSVISPIHVYNLRRGRTAAVVDCLQWSEDGQWLAVLTRKRTGHIFAVNSYGGRTDSRGHLDGKIKNPPESTSSPTDLYPLLRIRAASVEQEQQSPSFSFDFIKPTEYLLPSSVTSPPRSMASDRTTSPPLSPHDQRRHPNYVDGLLFDHISSSLSLRRVFLDLKPKDQGYTISAPGGFASTGLSLPALVGTPTRVSASSSFKSSSPLSGGIPSPTHQRLHTRASNASQSSDAPMELVAAEHLVMSWNLRRPWDGSQTRKSLRISAGSTANAKNPADWLAQAELSTHSKSKMLVPRSIYLSHQFLFHTLGEDYHALIRGYQLEVIGSHIEVRKQVQVSAHPAGEGESFVEGFSLPRDVRHRTVSSSFDEPLASALGADLDQPHSPTVLPMYPNGPATRGPPLRNSIPIRAVAGIGDNVTGRIRREFQRVRSPRLRPKVDDGVTSVPLEFDEEDEDFMDPHSQNPTTPTHSHQRYGSQVSQTNIHDGNEGDLWGGWSSTDRLAVSEAEKFDDINVLGLLDEERSTQKKRR